MSLPLIFFDFNRTCADPSRRAWSWITWKIRYTLNYKGIPYKTEWLEYPDVEHIATKYGAQPTSMWSDGTPRYTLPIIYDQNTHTAVSDSVEIAKYLDKTYPSTPSVFPEWSSALQVAFINALLDNVFGAYRKILDSRSIGVNPPSLAYWETKYPSSFVMTDDERAKETPAQLRAMEEAFGKVKGWLSANGTGREDLVMGDTACLADFQLAAILVSIRNIAGEESEVWKRICEWHDGKWKRYLNQFSAYATVNAS